VLSPSAPLAIRWTPGPSGPARIRLTVSIDEHGKTPALVSCDFPDTGAASVAAVLMAALFDAGQSGAPAAQLVRETADSVSVSSGCVELRVTADHPPLPIAR
jgi:hypothetical protein